MPIVANSGLPSFERFRREGGDVLTRDRAESQDIRELHIGLMNNMPDAALEATERQFLRLIGGCNRIAQFYVYPFSPASVARGPEARAHIDAFYHDFDQLKTEGLDALIVTGANPVCEELSDEAFWQPMCETLDWARENVTSTLCACLATWRLSAFSWRASAAFAGKALGRVSPPGSHGASSGARYQHAF